MAGLGGAELGVDELVAPHKRDAQLGGHHSAAPLDLDVVALADVVDVHRDGGVGADAVALHQANELRLGQVIWGLRLALHATLPLLGSPPVYCT